MARTPKRNHQPEGLPLGREGVERAVSGEAGSIRVSISLSVLGDFLNYCACIMLIKILFRFRF